jgi:hypothetical protein
MKSKIALENLALNKETVFTIKPDLNLIKKEERATF